MPRRNLRSSQKLITFPVFGWSRIASSPRSWQAIPHTVLFSSAHCCPKRSWHHPERTVFKAPKSSDSVPAFRYDSLSHTNLDNSANLSFRLLELRAGLEFAKIECNLTEFSLLDDVMYETISYRWDDEQRSIICNGTALLIPASLAAALRTLRYPDRPRLLWADAICINQDDDAEKGIQVQLMCRIYSQALGVLIWLGETEGQGDLEISVSFPAKMAIFMGLVALRPRMNDFTNPQVQIRDVIKGIYYRVAPFSVDFYIQLIGLLRKQWFFRAWVVQEVVVSKKATVVWGSKQCEWNDLIRALEFMSKTRFPLAFMPTLQHVFAIEEERKRYKQRNNTLIGLLLRHQRCLSTNPRDKVYAFCGLMGTSSAEAIDVPIRYGDSIACVYRDVATRILLRDRNLDILSHPPSPDFMPLRKSDLPSWVPDWRRGIGKDTTQRRGLSPISLASQEMDSQDFHKSSFSATGDSTYNHITPPTINSLAVSGYIFDTISAVGPVFHGVQIPTSASTLRGMVLSWLRTLRTFYQTRDVLLAWEDIAQARSPAYYKPQTRHSTLNNNNTIQSPTDEKIITAFYRTISASAYDSSAAIRTEIHHWNTVNRPFPFLRLLHLYNIIISPYTAVLLLWYGAVNGPLLKFELQRRHTLYRRFIRTDKGFIGLAGNGVRVGDRIVLCKGSRVPLVFRRAKEDVEADVGGSELEGATYWRLVGDAYVHGIMNGEEFDEGRCETMILI